MPRGAVINPETGWLEWTPGYDQAGEYDIEFFLRNPQVCDAQQIGQQRRPGDGDDRRHITPQ